MSQIRVRKSFDPSLFVAGAVVALASLAVAAWMLRLGDIVTAVGLGLLVVSGLLLAGIGLSSEPTAQ